MDVKHLKKAMETVANAQTLLQQTRDPRAETIADHLNDVQADIARVYEAAKGGTVA